ncbi:MAG: LD-carboxypeptidase [Proteobacteria bacterium]|nr:LD-carboxypeptidase [Pseudomonadota bacterium]
MSLLSTGDRVAIVAPSHTFNDARLAAGIEWIRQRGLIPVELPDLRRPHRRFSAPTPVRLQRLVQALSAPEYDAVWIVRGGSGMLQLLDALGQAAIAPRPVIGFSDVTALFCALDRLGDWPLVHGPVLHSIVNTEAESLAHLEGLLFHDKATRIPGESWLPGNAEGALVGGNLALLAATCGTSHQLDATGRLVFLEEIGELPYRVERLVQQLISSGVFRGATGIVLGEFLNCTPPGDALWTLRDGLMELLEPLGIPVLAGLPIGHGRANYAFKWGQPARIHNAHLHF